MSLKKVFLNTSEDFRGKTAAFYFSLFFLFSRATHERTEFYYSFQVIYLPFFAWLRVNILITLKIAALRNLMVAILKKSALRRVSC